MPIEDDIRIAMMIETGSILEGREEVAVTIFAAVNPKTIPTAPPTVERVADSIRN